MEMKFAQCVNKGMQRDYAMNTASQEFAYENKNIRITTTGDESFLAITNEKSTIPIKLKAKGLPYRDESREEEIKGEILKGHKLCFINVKQPTEIVVYFSRVIISLDGSMDIEQSIPHKVLVTPGVEEENEFGNPILVTYTDITEGFDELLNVEGAKEVHILPGFYFITLRGYIPIGNNALSYSDFFDNAIIYGSTICGEYLVLFTRRSASDYIFRAKIDYFTEQSNTIYCELVYSGELGLNDNMEFTTYYESDDVQKVYWVDGLNQPRVVNICKLNQTEYTTNLDFSPKIGGNIKVEIEKEQNGAGLFPAGEVQYFITYYNKFGQESQAAYVSPIYHISPNDKGGEADKTQTCSFRILISDVDKKYDHVRVYSAIRTTKNGEYIVSIVGDVSIYEHDNTYQIIDTNTNVINVPSSDILFLGGSVIFPSTIEQKDNTLFLGNIKTGVNTINEELDELKNAFNDIRSADGVINSTDLLKFIYKVVPTNFEDTSSLYPYNPDLTSNEYDTHFKLREKYRIGIQFIHETGEQSQTVFVGDIINKEHYPHYMSQDVMNNFEFSNTSNPNIVNNYYVDDSGNIHLYDVTNAELKYLDYLCLPIISFNSNNNKIKGIFDSIKAKGFNSYRLMVAETDYKDKSILCQGYINPLTFRSARRNNNECYGQESWTIRPIGTYRHLENINKCDDKGYTEFSEIRGSTSDEYYTKNAAIKVSPSSESSLSEIVLECTSTNYKDLGKDCWLRYRIYVKGTNKVGNTKQVMFSILFGPRTSIYNVYKKDNVDNDFIGFDTWTDAKIKSVADTFDVEPTILNTLGIKSGTRIFGYMPQYPWGGLEDEYQYNYVYHKDVRKIDVNLGSTALNSSDAYKENFFLDASQFSLNTPDLNNIQDILSSNPDLKCRIVGKIDIDRVTTDYNVTLEDTISGTSMSSVYKFNFSKVLNNDETAIGLKNFPVVYSVNDGKAYNLMLFEKDGPTSAEKNNLKPAETSPKNILKNKLIGNLWYASKTDYEFHWRYSVPYGTTTRYFPHTQFYKELTNYNDILDNYTTEAGKHSWYTGLINCDLDLYQSTTTLWDESKYIKGMFMLKDIEDLSYIKKWRWRRSGGTVTSFTNVNVILDDVINTNENIEDQVQVRMKYKPTNNVLLNLKPSFSDIYCLPGYANYDLQGNLIYMWSQTPFITDDDYIETITISGVLMQYDIITNNKGEPQYSDVFYVRKASMPDYKNLLEENKEYLLNVRQFPNTKQFGVYYDLCIITYIGEETIDWKYDMGIASEECYKFQISKSDSSFSVNSVIEADTKVPLYKIQQYYYDEELKRYTSSPKNITIKDIPQDMGSIMPDNTTSYLTSLKSFLGGDRFLQRTDYTLTDFLTQKQLFYPTNKFSRYLPFNLKGSLFDSPYVGEGYTIEGNGINNSLWICELYKDFDTFDFLGGTSENAIELNTFMPASKTCPIGTTAYGVYGDTYFKRWDHLRIYPSTDDDQTNGVVDAISLMVETYVNLDGDTRSARKRLDIRNMRPSNMEGLVNDVYSQKNNIITSHVLDDKFNVASHPLQYWWSLTKTPNSDIDTWTGVTLTSVAELDGDKGPLNKIKRWNNQLFAFQDKAIAMINFNNQTTIATQEGVPVEISNSGKVNGHYYITTNNGCSNKKSIVESPNGLYFIDNYNTSINVIGDDFKSLSQLNLFQDWIEQVEKDPYRKANHIVFKGFYDPIHKEIYYADGIDCICYNELLQQFTSFYDYQTMRNMFAINGHVYAITSKDKMYKMFEGDDYCNLFDTQCDYYMQYKINNEPFIDKTWTNLEYRADIFDRGNIQTNEFDTNNIVNNETFDSLKVWNEYQNGELDLTKVRFGYLRGAKPKFRIWRTNLPRAKATDTNRFGLDRIRNPWIMLELRKSGDTSKRMEFHDLIVKYVI